MLALSSVLAVGVIDVAAGRGIPSRASCDRLRRHSWGRPGRPVLTTMRQPHAGNSAAAVRLLFDATLPETVLVGRDGAVVRF